MQAPLVLLSTLLAASGADRPLVLLFSGDNAGEIEPCGWRSHPTGGLARRAGVIEKARREGKSVVVVDTGDALFRYAIAPPGDEKAKEKEIKKAELLLQAMGECGYAAFAVGERDLGFGYEDLVKKATAAKVTLLSANLSRDGTPAFERRKLVRTGGIRVGLFGLSTAPDPSLKTGLTRGDPVAAAREQVAALRRDGAELVVALAHLDYPEAQDVLRAVPGIDLMLQAHTQRVTQPEFVGNAALLTSGDRGRQLQRVELNLVGQGKFTDVSEISDAKNQLDYVNSQIRSVQERAKQRPEHKAAFQQTLGQLEARKTELEQLSAKKPEGRTLLQTIVALDQSAPESKQHRDKVAAFVAKYGATNR